VKVDSDLKSLGAKALCRFESGSGHQCIRFTRVFQARVWEFRTRVDWSVKDPIGE